MIEYWTDGSNKNDSLYSFGCVVVVNNEVVHEEAKAYSNEYCKYRNVAGETYGVLYAVLHAMEQGYKDINIYHDYIGLQKWADSEWGAKNELSQHYVKVVKQARQFMNITFHKVPAHSGVENNERADKLAKRAIEEWLE